MKKLIKMALQTNAIKAIKLRALQKNQIVTVLNLHRLYDDEAGKDARLKILEEMCQFFISEYNIVRINDIEGISYSEKPLLALSFDDGYKDFIEYGVPIFEKYGIRVNHNVIPTSIETGLPPLNAMVREFIRFAPDNQLLEFEIPGFGKIKSLAERSKFQQAAANFIKYKPFKDQEEIKPEIHSQIIERFEHTGPAMMSRSDVKSLLDIHDIGAHSYSHASMEVETLDFFQDDLVKCIDYFQKHFYYTPDIYAFPNGSYLPENCEILLRNGIKHILLVGENFTSLNSNIISRFTYSGTSLIQGRFEALGGTNFPFKKDTI